MLASEREIVGIPKQMTDEMAADQKDVIGKMAVVRAHLKVQGPSSEAETKSRGEELEAESMSKAMSSEAETKGRGEELKAPATARRSPRKPRLSPKDLAEDLKAKETPHH